MDSRQRIRMTWGRHILRPHGHVVSIEVVSIQHRAAQSRNSPTDWLSRGVLGSGPRTRDQGFQGKEDWSK